MLGVHRRNSSWTSKVDTSRMGACPPVSVRRQDLPEALVRWWGTAAVRGEGPAHVTACAEGRRDEGPVREDETGGGAWDRWREPPSLGPCRRPRPLPSNVPPCPWPPRRPRRAGRRPVGPELERAGGAETSTETRSLRVEGGASTVTETVTGACAGSWSEGPRPKVWCWCGPEPRP